MYLRRFLPPCLSALLCNLSMMTVFVVAFSNKPSIITRTKKVYSYFITRLSIWICPKPPLPDSGCCPSPCQNSLQVQIVANLRISQVVDSQLADDAINRPSYRLLSLLIGYGSFHLWINVCSLVNKCHT